MQDVLAVLEVADYAFLVELIESPFTFTDDRRLRAALEGLEAEDTPATRREMGHALEEALRYLGSADAAYAFRLAAGRPPGVPFREVVRDVAEALKVELSMLGTDRELVEELVQAYATRQFAGLTPEEQQRLLVELGVERDRAAAFLKKSAGVFTLPLLVQAFDVVVVQGLVKTVIFGTIARIVGGQLSARLFGLLAARLPWWVAWVGPVAWTLSLGWTAFDLQRPAYRKTIPAVLYLGLSSLRVRAASGG